MPGTETLTTKRLTLRRFRKEDAPLLYRDFGTDEAIYRYTGWNPYKTPEEAKKTVERYIANYVDDTAYSWAIEHKGLLIGTIGAYDADSAKRSIEIGLSIAKRHWGHGYGVEAMKCVIDYLISRGYQSVRAWCAVSNTNSKKALEKSGMRTLSIEKNAIRIGDKTYDKINYIYQPIKRLKRSGIALQAVLTPNGEKKLMNTLYDTIMQFSDMVDVGKIGLKGAIFGLDAIGDGATNAVFSLLRPVLTDIVKDEVLKPYHIFADVTISEIKKKGESLYIVVKAENINYTKSLTQNLPMITDALKKELPEVFPWEILDVLQEDTDVALTAFLNAVNDCKKDDIVRILIGRYHSDICEFLTQLLNDSNISLTVKELQLSK